MITLYVAVLLGCILETVTRRVCIKTISDLDVAPVDEYNFEALLYETYTSLALVREYLQRSWSLRTMVISNQYQYHIAFCQPRLDRISLQQKQLFQSHMRGGKGLSKLVTVNKYVHSPSSIHVTLSIGNATGNMRRSMSPFPLIYEQVSLQQVSLRLVFDKK